MPRPLRIVFCSEIALWIMSGLEAWPATTLLLWMKFWLVWEAAF